MSTQTEHYQLSLREGTDIFNPLSTNDNFTKIDELLFQGASGGLVTGTPVVSGSLLSFQGLTLAAADTVVKFKLEDSQSVSSVTFGGSTIPIVDLSGASKTLTGGFWIGYVDTNSKFRVIAYPDVVNAQTFNGEAASYYATKAGLDAVNETAGNAVSTATAAATVANQALQAAGNAGFNPTLAWTNSNPSAKYEPATVTFQNPDNKKFAIVVCVRVDPEFSPPTIISSYYNLIELGEIGSAFSGAPDTGAAIIRKITASTLTSITFGYAYYVSGASQTDSQNCPYKIYLI